jgi:hypothetical protein
MKYAIIDKDKSSKILKCDFELKTFGSNEDQVETSTFSKFIEENSATVQLLELRNSLITS